MTKIEQLSARFPAEAHGQRAQGGRTLTYIGIDSTIQRLNEVFGLSYSTEILEVRFQGDFVMVWASLTYKDEDGNSQKKHGVGVDKLDARDPDKCVKTAYAEAIKKASHQLGVGLYLWDDKERAEVEAEMKGARAPNRSNTPTPGNALNLPIQIDPTAERPTLVGEAATKTGKKVTEIREWCKKKGFPLNSNEMTPDQFLEMMTHIYGGKVVFAS